MWKPRYFIFWVCDVLNYGVSNKVKGSSFVAAVKPMQNYTGWLALIQLNSLDRSQNLYISYIFYSENFTSTVSSQLWRVKEPTLLGTDVLGLSGWGIYQQVSRCLV